MLKNKLVSPLCLKLSKFLVVCLLMYCKADSNIFVTRQKHN